MSPASASPKVSQFHRRHRIVLRWSVCAAFVVLLVSAATATAANRTRQLDGINIGVLGPGVSHADLYMADAQGLFAAQGLNVHFITVSANSLPFLISGTVDLVLQGVTFGVIAANSGAPSTKLIYASLAGGTSAYVAAGPKITSLSQCKRMATSALGTSSYGWASYYKSKLKLSYDLISFNDPTASLAAVESGNVDCLTTSQTTIASGVVSGKLHYLVNPESVSTIPKAAVLPLSKVVSGGLIGLDSWLTSHRSDVERLIKALYKGQAFIDSNPTVVSAALSKYPDLAPLGLPSITDAFTHSQKYFAPFGGYFTKAVWETEEAWMIAGGNSFINPADPKWAYSKFVDMSYFDDALAGQRTIKTDKTHRTLVTIAAKALGDRTLWARFYPLNKKFFTKSGVTQAKAKNYTLPVGLTLRY